MSFDRNFNSVLDITYGNDVSLDALLLHFMTENHLEYTIEPDKNGSREQLKFMLDLDEKEFYAPCSDWMFLMLIKGGLPRVLLDEYLDQWKTFVHLTRNFCAERKQASRFLQLARHKFRMVLASPIVIPSRLLKRLVTIFMTQSGIDDPYRGIRKALNRRAAAVVKSKTFDTVVNTCPREMDACPRIDDLRYRLDMLEIERLMRISTLTDNWSPESFAEEALIEADINGEIEQRPDQFEPVRDFLGKDGSDPKRILYIPNRAGGLIFDLQVVKTLLRLGHRVVMALKEGFYFEEPTFWDPDNEPELTAAFNGAYFAADDRLSKNQLLELMSKHAFVVISDGTREKFNPYRCSVTFARAWKECDLILAKGEGLHNRLVQISHGFTRDIINFFRDESNHFHLHYKPKPEWVHKFSERYISGKADEIISQMREARERGHTVIFYSGIIGSVPGQTKAAIEVITTFVNHLREQLDEVFIINPGEHFEEGMDADDLMFMWEKVQRSGYINVWRFQTYFDIEKSFELMNRKVPPVWTGKDATYSTGCTKEMHIALDVQRTHPELQIIGPNPEKFFRRREYGVGKFCDVAIDSCNA
ncbi:ARMT1-like domain-containing protein [Pseudodesulfovibrio sp.]|uniref:ARMT1-like domain-containing protein n=1 Tax=unclassified Pseudodesulfovibrio TaxID=2661612 RepID=UPI003AFFF101